MHKSGLWPYNSLPQPTTPLPVVVSLLCVFFLVALALRLSASRFGLPFLYDPDEIAFTEPAIRIIRSGDWNPGWFGHPGTTTIYLNVAVFEFVHSLRSYFASVQELPEDYYINPYAYTYAARAAYSVISSCSVVLTYLLGRQIGLGTFPSLTAAAIVAFSSLHIIYSALIRTDTLAAFLMLSSLIYCTGIVRDGGIRHYIASGMFAGVAIATKYPLVICCITIAAAHVLSNKNWLSEWPKLGVAAVATVVATFFVSPYLFIDYESALSDISREAFNKKSTAAGQGIVFNLLWYGERSQNWFGNLPIIGVLIGVLVCFIEKRKTYAPPVIFFVLFIVFISSLSVRWDRWLVPIIPVGAILCGITLNFFCSLRGRMAAPGRLLALVLASTAVFQFAVAARSTVATRIASDTRTAAAVWISESLPAGSLILVDSGGPQLPREKFRIGLFGFGDGSGRVSFVYRNEYMNVIPRFSDPARSDAEKVLQEGKPDYVVLSSSVSNRYRGREEWQQFETLFAAGDVIREVKPGIDAERGPTLWIIRVAKD